MRVRHGDRGNDEDQRSNGAARPDGLVKSPAFSHEAVVSAAVRVIKRRLSPLPTDLFGTPIAAEILAERWTLLILRKVLPNGIGGVAVHAGARIMALGRGFEIIVSSVTRGFVEGGEFRFEERGRHELRGLEQPIDVFLLVRSRPVSAAQQAADWTPM